MKKSTKTTVVWQLSVVHFQNKSLLQGTLLKTKNRVYKPPKNGLENFLEVIQSYLKKVDSERKIRIEANSEIFTTTTDKQGNFSVMVDVLATDIKIFDFETHQEFKIIQAYPTIFRQTKSNFDVISDIDDTIIISYTAQDIKRVGTLTLIKPQNRKAIAFTKKVLEDYEKQNARFYYVSKSEGNLFGILSSFIIHNRLPKGPLFLTPYLSFSNLIKSEKKQDFKLVKIRLILNNETTKQFILFGDDSQKDIEIYSTIIKEFPGRISKVFIRQTRNKIRPHQKEALERLKLNPIPVVYFNNQTDFNSVNI